MKNLSVAAKAYITGSILVGLSILAWQWYDFSTTSLWLTVLLCILGSLSLILKVEGSTNRSHYDVSFLVYAFSFVVLSPEEALLVILVSNLAEWAWHKYPWYIQSFNISSYIIALHVANFAYVVINPDLQHYTTQGVAGLLVALGIFTFVNHLLVGFVIWLARGENFSTSGVLNYFPLMLDYTLLSLGAGAALIYLVSPAATVLVLLPLYLIYTTLKVPALERKSESDPKTGLFNARYFERSLQNELKRANRFDRPLTVVMADLDLLRNINNAYGHLAGDEVLIGVANILRNSVREYDVVSRFGGEEFALLMPETTPEDAFRRVEEMRQAIMAADFLVPTSVTPIKSTMSFGIAGRTGFSQTGSDIVHNADAALYHGKLRGRNCTYLYSDDGFVNLFGEKGGSAVELASNGGYVSEAAWQAGQQPVEPEPPPIAAVLAGKPDLVSMPKPAPAAPEDGSPPPEPKPPTAEPHAVLLPKWAVNVYITILAAAAMLLSLYLVPLQPVQDWLGLGMFFLMVVLTEGLAIDIYVRNTAVSTSAAPLAAGTLVFGPLGAVVLSLAFAITAFIKHRSPASRLVFNASNQIIAGMIYTALLLFARRPFLELPDLMQFLVTLGATSIVYLVTTGLITVGMSMDFALPVREVWHEQFSWLAPYYLAMAMIAYALIFGFQTGGLLGMLVVLGPLLVVRLSQKQYIDRTRVFVNQVKEKNAALERSALEIEKLNEGLLDALVEVADLRDPYVLGHSRQVAQYSVLIAQKLGLPPRQVELVRKAGLLHDIGKLGISEAILFKPESLSYSEYQLVKSHASLGADILEKSRSLGNLIPIIRYHHEWYNGNGYPEGLRGNDIPLEARIVAVADAIEAMASDRPYQHGRTQEEILSELQKQAGTQFDPFVVNAFVELVRARGEEVVTNWSRQAVAELSKKRPTHTGRP